MSSIFQFYQGMLFFFFFSFHVNNVTLSTCVGISFLDATPTAELEPITETYVQADEVLSYTKSDRYSHH